MNSAPNYPKRPDNQSRNNSSRPARPFGRPAFKRTESQLDPRKSTYRPARGAESPRTPSVYPSKAPYAPSYSPRSFVKPVSKPVYKDYKEHKDEEKTSASLKTSWGKVADWYDEYLADDDSYQKQVILPNLMRVLDPKPREKILDIACGQGFFAEEIAVRGADVIGFDISHELIKKAQYRTEDAKLKNIKFFTAPADDMSAIGSSSIDNAVCVLAAQNIKELDAMFAEAARVLKRAKPQDRVGMAIRGIKDSKKSSDYRDMPSFKGGRLILVLNHPAFRIPRGSDWHFEDKAHDPHQGQQGRTVYQYLSEGKITIDMNPGIPKERSRDKVYTVSYHRPLQVFMKWLSKHGFAITKIEEWASHKRSATGPRATAEDTARKEIPLFMCIEASLLG